MLILSNIHNIFLVGFNVKKLRFKKKIIQLDYELFYNLLSYTWITLFHEWLVFIKGFTIITHKNIENGKKINNQKNYEIQKFVEFIWIYL